MPNNISPNTSPVNLTQQRDTVNTEPGSLGRLSEIEPQQAANLSRNAGENCLRASSERAVALAELAGEKGTFGVGAVLLHDDKPIAEAANEVIKTDRSNKTTVQHTLHAEMQLLNWYAAQQRQHKPVPPTHQLTVVTSLAPCLMCLSRMMKQDVGAIKYIADDADAGITDRNAGEYLPETLATASSQHLEPIADEPLIKRSLDTFSTTCHEIRERAGGAPAPRKTRAQHREQQRRSLLGENGDLTEKGRTVVSEYFSKWAGSPLQNAAIVAPDKQFSIDISKPTDWPENIEYNLMRELVKHWDALPEHNPSLEECIALTTQSLDISEGSAHTQWDTLQTIGVLSSAAEGAPLVVLTNQPLSDAAKQHISALPMMCDNLRIEHFPYDAVNFK